MRYEKIINPAGDCLRTSFGQLQNLLKRRSIPQSPFAGPLDHRPVGHRVAEGDAEFDDIRTGINCREDDIARGREVGIAAGDVGDERGTVLER